MYKLAIVDDEYWVRKGLSETIEWETFGVEVVGTAADGEEALKLIEREAPDILITDMRMPGHGRHRVDRAPFPSGAATAP